MFFDQELVSQLSKGAQVLGGGGGGREARGLKTAGEAMASGQVRLAELGEISPSDLVVTVSGVGAPPRARPCTLPGTICGQWSCWSSGWTGL